MSDNPFGRWTDLRVPALSTKTGGSKIPGLVKIKDNGAGSQGILVYSFDDGTEEELYFVAQMPHEYALGTPLHAHVHWTPDGNGGSGEVVSWGLEYSVANIGDVFPNTQIAYGNSHIPADASLVDDKHYLTEIGTIDMSSVDSVSAMILCRVFRNATGAGSSTDDFGNDARLLEIDFHYIKDDNGSKSEYTK